MGCTYSASRKTLPEEKPIGRSEDLSNYGGPYRASLSGANVQPNNYVNYRIQPVNASKKDINPDITKMFGI